MVERKEHMAEDMVKRRGRMVEDKNMVEDMVER